MLGNVLTSSIERSDTMPNEKILKKMKENAIRWRENQKKMRDNAGIAKGIQSKRTDDTMVFPWIPPCPPVI